MIRTLKLVLAWILRILAATLLAAMIALSGYVGFPDALLAPQLGERVVGMILAALCLILVLGIISLFISEKTRPWSAVAFLAGSLIGVIFLVAQVSAHERSVWRFIVWSLFIVGPLTLSAILWIRGPRLTAPRQLAVIGSILTFTVGILQAVYTTAYAPIKHPDTLTAQVSATTIADNKAEALGYQAMKSNYTLKNEGDVKLLILGSLYTVVGVNSEYRDSSQSQNFDKNLPNDILNQTWSGRYENRIDLEPVEIGTDPLTVGSWIPAGGESAGTIISHVPTGHYSYYIFTIYVATARADRLTFGNQLPTEHMSKSDDGTFLYTIYPLQQISLNKMTQGPRQVEIHYLVDGSSPALGWLVGSPSHNLPDAPYVRALSQYYGVFQTWGVSEETLTRTPTDK